MDLDTEKSIMPLETRTFNLGMMYVRPESTALVNAQDQIGKSPEFQVGSGKWQFKSTPKGLSLCLLSCTIRPLYVKYTVEYGSGSFHGTHLFFGSECKFLSETVDSWLKPHLDVEMMAQADEIGVSQSSSIQKMIEDFGGMLNDHSTSDQTIETADGESFKVHKVILASRSPVFQNKIKELLEIQSTCIQISTFGGKTVGNLLRYVYTSQVPSLDTESAIDLLKAANEYALDELKVACVDYLVLNFELTNVARIFLLADHYNFKDLRQKALKFISENQSRFKSEHYASLTSHPEFLLEILISNSKDN